jgi:hypothetical protein
MNDIFVQSVKEMIRTAQCPKQASHNAEWKTTSFVENM